MVHPRPTIVRGVPSEGFGSSWSNGMAHEIIRPAEDAFICRQVRVVLVRVQDIQGELYLGETFVKVHVWTIAMESRSSRNNVVFCGLDSPFRAIAFLLGC
jgi:hypothetical protein